MVELWTNCKHFGVKARGNRCAQTRKMVEWIRCCVCGTQFAKLFAYAAAILCKEEL